jgi:peptidylprolyl isomerase
VTDDVQDRTTEDAPDGPEVSPAPAPRSGAATPAAAVPVVRKPSSANLRRQAKKEAARRAAEARRRAKRRKQMITYSGVAAFVVIVLVGGYLLLGGGNDNKTASGSGASASATPTAGVSTPAELSQKPVVDKGTGTVTELKVTPLVTGTGPKVESGQTITVNYVGVTYADGKQFDSSWDRANTFSTVIGQGQVIPGWDQGLVGQTVGSRVQLDIPGNLAYGDNPTGGQPGGTLRFVVDILEAH